MGSIAHPLGRFSVRDPILVAGPVGALMHGRDSHTGVCCNGRDGGLFPRRRTSRMFVQEMHSGMNLVLIELCAELKVDPSLHSEVL